MTPEQLISSYRAAGQGQVFAFWDSLDARGRAELIAQGVEMMGPPRDIPSWGHRAIFFRDTEGNVIEIYAEV